MLIASSPSPFWAERAAIHQCHSGAREARARNPSGGREGGEMDSGFATSSRPGMTSESQATNFSSTPINASGVVTFGA